MSDGARADADLHDIVVSGSNINYSTYFPKNSLSHACGHQKVFSFLMGYLIFYVNLEAQDILVGLIGFRTSKRQLRDEPVSHLIDGMWFYLLYNSIIGKHINLKVPFPPISVLF